MYGMINEAIRRMVTEGHGVAAWEALAARASCPTSFLRMSQYPDAITYDLVAAASAGLGTPVSELLESFGSYWIDFASEHYGELFDLWGDSFPDTVANLNALHTRIGQMLPELQPPSFSLSERDGHSFLLHYYSRRAGLEPMVIGLLQGIGRHFATAVEVAWLRDHSPDHAVFRVQWGPRSGDA